MTTRTRKGIFSHFCPTCTGMFCMCFRAAGITKMIKVQVGYDITGWWAIATYPDGSEFRLCTNRQAKPSKGWIGKLLGGGRPIEVRYLNA